MDILKKYIKNGNDIENILNKINESKIYINTNKKYKFNYYWDFIFIILRILNPKEKKDDKNPKNEIKENKKEEYKELINELYNNFIQYYKPIDEIVSFNEKTGHINFQIKNQEEYLNNMKNNDKNKILMNINKMNSSNNNNINNNNNNNKNKNNINKILKNDYKNKEIQKEKYIFEYFPEIVTDPEVYLPLKHTYTIELTDKITLLNTEERFLLYNKYQRAVHNENSNILTYNFNWGLSIIDRNK